MKRIVVNALNGHNGGGLTYLLNFLTYMDNEEVELLFLAGEYNIAALKQAAGGKKDVQFYLVPAGKRNLIFRQLWETFLLPRFLRKWNADVYYAPGGLMLTPMPHGCCSATAIRNMLLYDTKERKRYPLFSPMRFKLWLSRQLSLLSLRMADLVIFISRYSQEQVQRELPRVAKKARLIPHGINPMFLREPRLDFHPGEPLTVNGKTLKTNEFYLYVSALRVYKSQKELVESWKILCESGFPHPLVFCGEIDDRYGLEVQEMIARYHLEEKVIVLGHMDYSALPDLYAASRALVFASSCECCPNILLEKMAAGKPLFASDIPPMPEFGGVDTIYFAPENPADLVQKILQAEQNWSEMCDRGKRLRGLAGTMLWSRSIKRCLDCLCALGVKQK